MTLLALLPAHLLPLTGCRLEPASTLDSVASTTLTQASSTGAPAVGDSATSSRPAVESMGLTALAAEYRALRTLRGHSSRPPGKWLDAVDAAGGRKDRVMGELGKRLGAGTTRLDPLTALLGAPDDVARPGSTLWALAMSVRRPDGGGAVDELEVYEWRGLHDLLFFEVRQGRVLRSDWWAAGD
jgi:hypothetical protein